ncbi:hypothetical protein B566_EDAN011990 [Ephemera danica]|nr:hypothetical protein B566_EDAN011990 [Ephemera danica]
MGEQVENQQQTQVLLLNGQTIILEGDVGENSINEINAEILEQALQETPSNINNSQPTSHNQTAAVSNNSLTINQSSTGTVPQESVGEFEGSDANNFVAIFENENGETQTVQLTLEQAAALGFQVTNEVPTAEPENKKQQHAEGSSSMSLPAEGTKMSTQDSTPSLTQSAAPETSILGSILKTAASPMVSVVPQYVGDTVSYSVKMPEAMELNTNMPDYMPSTAQGSTTLAPSSVASSHTIDMSRAPSNAQKPSVLPATVDPSQSVVRLKTPNTTVASTATIRPMTSKTVIPKIQGTPTSMSNLTMSPALPISSTASMVRVLNSAATSSVKPSTATSVSTTQVKNIDTSSVPLVAANATKPLGSSENPIQLVQHGQTFHSMQPLSQEQLKQIATVLQQKQLDTSRNSKNVLYDANTNTRIIYRVVYPEDLALKKPTHTVSSAKGRGGSTAGGRKGRPPKSSPKGAGTRRISDDDDDLALDTDLSKGEREERKKVLPRTRSGRLSRPPRHMVKDYKRIHHLDFAEPDLDDSDGGYSDYRISDAETLEANADPAVSGESSQQHTQQGTQDTGNNQLL